MCLLAFFLTIVAASTASVYAYSEWIGKKWGQLKAIYSMINLIEVDSETRLFHIASEDIGCLSFCLDGKSRHLFFDTDSAQSRRSIGYQLVAVLEKNSFLDEEAKHGTEVDITPPIGLVTRLPSPEEIGASRIEVRKGLTVVETFQGNQRAVYPPKVAPRKPLD